MHNAHRSTFNHRRLLGIVLLAQSHLVCAEPPSPVTALAFSPDGKQLLVGRQGEVRSHPVDESREHSRFPCSFPKISAFAFSPDERTLAIGGGTAGVNGGIQCASWPSGTI